MFGVYRKTKKSFDAGRMTQKGPERIPGWWLWVGGGGAGGAVLPGNLCEGVRPASLFMTDMELWSDSKLVIFWLRSDSFLMKAF